MAMGSTVHANQRSSTGARAEVEHAFGIQKNDDNLLSFAAHMQLSAYIAVVISTPRKASPSAGSEAGAATAIGRSGSSFLVPTTNYWEG